MSRRTAEANKAIRLAWQRESELVQEGKGTRDWTEEQQKDILNSEIGKAYDEKGRAYEGQHMKSVEKYPEYQGDPNNIQFLTKDEHLEAHKGNWQNPTNWYYDPEKKKYFDFGNGEIIPVKPKELSSPIYKTKSVSESDNHNESSQNNAKAAETKESTTAEKSKTVSETVSSKQQIPSKEKGILRRIGTGTVKFVKGAGKVAKKAIGFVVKHPGEFIGGVLTFAAGAYCLYSSISSSNNGSSGDYYSSNSNDHEYDYNSESYSTSSQDVVHDNLSTEKDYPEERSSPREHSVSGYDRIQNGKTVHVNPYKRGGKNKDD